jgi:hypothetical protein
MKSFSTTSVFKFPEMLTLSDTIAACGGMFTNQAFQEMWVVIPKGSAARKELCYQLEKGIIELVPARRRAWGRSRAPVRFLAKFC